MTDIGTTILSQWRDEERENLTQVYDAMEDIIRHPDGKVPQDKIASLRDLLGIPTFQVTAGDEHRTFVFGLADDKLEVGNETERYEARLTQLQRWRDELASDARWNRYSEVDGHVIHLHMVRIHGNKLNDFFRTTRDIRGFLPYAIDAVESDALSIHLLSARCSGIDPSFEVDPSTDFERRQQIVKRSLEIIAESGPRWSTLPGMQRRGISISTGMKTDAVKIDGDTVILETKAFPEALISKNFIGQPLHEVIDLGGYRNKNLTITRAGRIPNTDKLAFNINRNAKHMRVRIPIDHTLFC